MYKSLLSKRRDGTWDVKTSDGKKLGNFKTRELADQRLWQYCDQQKKKDR